MKTTTNTYTKTDVRRVFENFEADLIMLVYRTQAMELSHAGDCFHDIILMATEDCLSDVHIQLHDENGVVIKAYKYHVGKDISWGSARPGGNKWPYKPDGKLHIIVTFSDKNKAEELKNSGALIFNWGPSDLSIDYSNMNSDTTRYYSSNGYGLNRSLYT